MLTLLTFPAGFGQFSLSPFCVKAAYLLQMSGQPWQRQDLSDPRKMRYQKLPVLKVGQQLIADSEAIRIWLESQGAEFDRDLDDRQKAYSRAVIRMAEEHVLFHLALDRWGNDDVWPTIREVYFKTIPKLLRKPLTNMFRKSFLKGMHTQGLGRFTAPERAKRLEPDLHALAVLLKETPFLFGKRPTAADISVVSMLAAIKATPVRTALVTRVAKDPVLSDYVIRMTEAMPLP